MRTANIFQLNNKKNRTEKRKGEKKEKIVKETGEKKVEEQKDRIGR